MASSLNTPEHLEKLRNEAALKSINEGRKNKGQKPLDKLPPAMQKKSDERLRKAKSGNKPITLPKPKTESSNVKTNEYQNKDNKTKKKVKKSDPGNQVKGTFNMQKYLDAIEQFGYKY